MTLTILTLIYDYMPLLGVGVVALCLGLFLAGTSSWFSDRRYERSERARVGMARKHPEKLTRALSDDEEYVLAAIARAEDLKELVNETVAAFEGGDR